jgi:succinate dehydrogenase / fumarate reductase cytochrome b subunit
MATAPAASSESFFSRHYFLLRRLHSLSGVVPIGAYLFPHLTTNSSIVWGEYLSGGGVHTFQHEVNFIHSLPALVLIEIGLIWLPLLYHAAFGIYIATTGRSNVRHYNYQDNWRYTWQRLTGYIALVFILYHVATLRWGWDWLPLAGGFDVDGAASSTAVAMRGGEEAITWKALVIGGLYLVGVLATVFHFANGLWTAAITWGLTITVQAQKRWGYVCAAVGLGLAAAGVASVIGFMTLDVEEARAVEKSMLPVAAPFDVERE